MFKFIFMRKIIAGLYLSVTGIFLQYAANAQNVGIGTTTPNVSAQLDINSNSKGILVPRVSLVSIYDVETIANPATSLLVYNTNAGITNGSGVGFYYNMGNTGAPVWTRLLSGTSGWSLTGNAVIDPAIHFVGTTDGRPLRFRVSNDPAGEISPSSYSTYFGQHSGESSTYGSENTGIGFSTLRLPGAYRCTALGAYALFSNQQFGYYNTSVGALSMYSNTTGAYNTAVGTNSLYSNLTGNRNVAIGDSAMYGSTNASFSIGIGMNALKTNTAGSIIGIGRFALQNNSGSHNIAIGDQSMRANTTGSHNVGIGTSALNDNTTGTRNTGVGYNSLRDNSTGGYNTAYGSFSMAGNTFGSYNTVVGYNAMSNTGGSNVQYNVAIGPNALRNSDGADNVAIGNEAMAGAASASGNVAIGSFALESITYNTGAGPWESNNIAIGKFAMQETRPSTNNNGYRNVVIGTSGLRTNTTGSRNIVLGNEALRDNTTASNNIAIGDLSLRDNTTGYLNISIGNQASLFNDNGYNNTVIGHSALRTNSGGWGNTVLGANAMYSNTTGVNNTAIGLGSGSTHTASTTCTFIGYEADQSTSGTYANSTAIGANSRVTASNQVRLGSSGIGSIGGYAAWSNLSDGRFKRNITESVKGLDFIMALRPVTYNVDVNAVADYLKEDEYRDSSGKILKHLADAAVREQRNRQSAVLQTGFIAQDVEAAAQKLGYEFSGVDKPKNAEDLYALRYSEFVVPLVKAVQEQQKEITELKQLLIETQKALAELKRDK